MIICVTGPMAAGKNFICSKFEQSGWLSLDADRQVHTAIEKASPLILNAFKEDAEKAGINLKNPDGTLNRRALGALIFPKPELLARQELLVYPYLVQDTKDFIAAHKDSNIILNATVLYKTPEMLSLCSKIVFVNAPAITRLFRARRRDHMSYKQIFQRFHSQKTLLSKYLQSGIPVKIYTNTGKFKEEKFRSFLNQLICENSVQN